MKKFPLFEQFDQMDCGPTCLKMIAKFYGVDVPLHTLREKMFASREGVSLLSISNAAEQIGFSTLSVRLPFEKLKDVTLPCIVHWNQNHFVVVYKITSSFVHVADPVGHRIKYKHSEFEKCWNAENGEGIVLMLEPSDELSRHTTKTDSGRTQSLINLLRYIKNYKRDILKLAIGLVLGSLIQLAFPFLTQAVVDVGIKGHDINFIYLILIGQFVLITSRTVIEMIRRKILLIFSTRINISIISDFLAKLLKLPLSFFDSKMIGDLLRRIEDHSRIERLLTTSFLNVLFSFFNLCVFGIILTYYDAMVSLVFFLFSIAYVAYVLMFMKKRAELDYQRFSEVAGNQSHLIQVVHGMPDIKINNCEDQKREEWKHRQEKIFQINIAGIKLQQYQDAGSLFINEFKNIVITCMAAIAVVNGEMTLGMMLTVQYIIGSLNGPVNDFITFSRDWQDAQLSMDRIGEVHEAKNEEEDVNDLSSISAPASNTLIIKDLSFSYDGPHTPSILKNIDLIIPEGKVTAIVGVSGSGKTTLLKLLLKFYTPQEGSVLWGGSDLQKIPSSMWRRKCGVVMQDGYIFSDSIEKNIALSDKVVDADRLRYAATIANIRDYIESLPLGYNTRIGTNGILLSQGQKQRLLIARAVYKNPEFIFFDEATSSLDANNERKIMDNLNQYFRGKTVLVIAHRLSTVKKADQIVVLKNGRIVQSGTHAELTSSRGEYFELVRNQLELGN